MTAVVTIRVLSAQPASARASIASESIVNQLKSGQTVDLDGVDVTGGLDLRPLVEVNRLLRCRNCHLQGALLAEDVVFDKALDLSGSQVDGPVEIVGATFESAVTFNRVRKVSSRFAQATSFGGATFADTASFSGAVFAGEADFSSAKFRADARFDNADFRGRAAFEATVFGGPATFTSFEEPSATSKKPATPEPTPSCMADRDRGAFEAAATFSRSRWRSV